MYTCPFGTPSGTFWHAKDFTKTPEVEADAGETHLGVHAIAYDAFMNDPMVLLCFIMFSQSPPNLKISLIVVCPSGVNFGTV